MKDLILKVLLLHDSQIIAKSKTYGRIYVVIGGLMILGAALNYTALNVKASDHYESTQQFVSQVQGDQDIPGDNKQVAASMELILHYAESLRTVPLFLLLFLSAFGLATCWHGLVLIRVHQVITNIQREQTER